MGIFGNLFGRKKQTIFPPPQEPLGFNPQGNGGAWENPESQPDTLSFDSPQQRRFDIPDVNIPSEPQKSFSPSGQVSPKDIQLILSKLDLIDSRLENLSRRLEADDATRKVERRLW